MRIWSLERTNMNAHTAASQHARCSRRPMTSQDVTRLWLASVSKQWRMNTGTQGRTFVFQLLEDAAGQPHAERPQPPPPCEGRGLLLWTNTKAHQHQRKMIVNTTDSSASVARHHSGLMRVITSQQQTG